MTELRSQTSRALAGLLLSSALGACAGPSVTAPPEAPPTREAAAASSETELPPDPAESAQTPPTPDDALRYTRDLPARGQLVAILETTQGSITCELFEERAPLTVANFVGLARGLKAHVDPHTDRSVTGLPFYDGQRFHRVIPGFLIQGGDPTGTGYGGPGYVIPDEFDPELRHDRPGTLSMANLGPDSGGSQFFITEVAAPHLDDRHTVFGRCADLETVRAISHIPTDPENRPTEDVQLLRVIIERRAD
ncbi:peptidylprolyl isomerase [Lujinxingia vulgaris]|uniref:Peptidyl-prolyl cis-trans isomerase n=1 Tax=Lujinxingia vulgaris TaxID=2600176 RepID=A0A5C6XCZ6_9DELT|nr:peptidylprolyl isomerase [Lujinxingia vulgaris]TXD39903.1 peptidylprolyl isomerase [Lujinxingia vulgaris]